MLRRIKAIYIIPVALVLLIGAAIGSFYVLFKPQMEKVDAARKTWDDAKKAAQAAEGGYQASIDDQVKYSGLILKGFKNFHQIQDTMPQIDNLKEVYTGKDRDGLRAWYKMWGTGQYIGELNHWVQGFHLQTDKPITFSFSKDKLGYEDTLSSLKLIEVPFGTIKFEKKGYNNLLNAIAQTTGYGYFPLIIDSSEGGSFTVELPKDARKSYSHDPKNPICSISLTAKGYFFTRGWDPVGTSAAKDLTAKATAVIETPPQVKKGRTEFSEPCPTVLWIFPPKDVTP